MLFRSLECRGFANHHESVFRQVVFSDVQILQPTEGSLFTLTPTGSVGAAWAYTLEVRVFSPPMEAGTMMTSYEHVLDDVRTLLSYLLDITLHADVDGCRALGERRLSAELCRLVPERFKRGRVMTESWTSPARSAFESVTSKADSHLLVVLRATKAYERAMVALARGQRDLAYVLLVFVLECLAQVRERPKSVEWEAYPPRERDAIDSVFDENDVAEAVAQQVRTILATTKHLRVSENFRQFVVGALGPEFFDCDRQPQVDHPSLRLRGSLMPRLLDRAYATRSGFAHALSPIAETVSAEWQDEYCVLRSGEPALTFRGLHRVVRGVAGRILEERRAPPQQVAPPDPPGVVQRKWSYTYWLYQTRPKSNGADALGWLRTLLGLHIRHCAEPNGETPPPDPIPVGAIGVAAAKSQPTKRHRPATLALAWVCGHSPTQQVKCTLETIVARVFVDGSCHDDPQAAARELGKQLRGTDPNKLLEFPPVVLVAVWVAMARDFAANGHRTESLRWLERARDDSVHDPQLQSRIAECMKLDEPISPHDILFPRTTRGVLLEGFRVSDEPDTEESEEPEPQTDGCEPEDSKQTNAGAAHGDSEEPESEPRSCTPPRSVTS